MKGVWHFVQNVVVGEISTFFESVYDFLEAFVRNAHVFLSKEKYFLLELQSIFGSERSVGFLSICYNFKEKQFL